MTKIDREEIERVIDDLETKRDYYKQYGDLWSENAYQYAIARLKELL